MRAIPAKIEAPSLGGEGAGLDDRDRAPPAEAGFGGGDDEVAKEGVELDPKKLLPPEGPRSFLPRRWVVERTFAWISHNRRMAKDYERLC